MAGPFQAGQKITAAQLDSFCAPLCVIKPADQSVTSSTTLVNDTALFVPVVVSATYDVTAAIIYEGGTLNASDIKWQWTVPAGAVLRLASSFLTLSGTANVGGLVPDTTVETSGSAGAGNSRTILLEGSLIMAGTAGNLTFQWAQNTSNATATIVHAQSKLRLWRIT